MSERPSRQERIETRQANQMDRREAREKDMTLEEFREDRRQLREDFQKGQMDKLASNPFKMKLDANLQMEGVATIKAWDGEFKFLRNMLQAAYEKANDPRASEKARALLNKIQDTLGTDVLKTEGTVVKIAGNQLMMVGALTSKSLAIEDAQALEQEAQVRPMVATKPQGPNWDDLPEYRPTLVGQAVNVEMGDNGLPKGFEQRADGTYTNVPELQSSIASSDSPIDEYDPSRDGFYKNDDGFWTNIT